MPKVSVIIPTHNPGNYFIPLIKSVIKQTLTDIEIIIIDDGSTDGTREIIKGCALVDNRIQYIFREKNPSEVFGEKYSVDIGRSMAKGEYIVIIDHDDELMLNMLEELYNNSENGTIDVIQGKSFSIDENNEISWIAPNFWPQITTIYNINNLDNQEIYKHLIAAAPQTWVNLIRNDFQKNIELIDAVYNDSTFIWEAKIMAKSFKYIPKFLYIHNDHHSSTSGMNNHNKYYKHIFINFHRLKEILLNLKVDSNILIIYTLFEFHTLMYMKNGNFTDIIFNDFMNQFTIELNNNINLENILYNEDLEIYNQIKSGNYSNITKFDYSNIK